MSELTRPKLNLYEAYRELKSKLLRKELPGYACMRVSSTGVSTITGSFQAVNVANLGGGLSWQINKDSSLITTNITDGYLLIEADMICHMIVSLSYSPDDNSTTEVELTIGIDSGAGIVTQEANINALTTTTATTATENLVFACIPEFKEGDKVYLMIRRNSGTADITIKSANLPLHNIGE